MGDVLHALPAVTALRNALPESWIGWAIEPQWESLLRAQSRMPTAVRGPQMPVVDVIHTVPAKRWARNLVSPVTFLQIRNVRRVLRAQQYDLCIDLQGAVRSAWLGRMAAASRLIGEANPREPLARWLFNERVRTTGVHVIEQAREVVAAAVRNSFNVNLPDVPAALPVDPEAERWCDTWLAERGASRFVLMNPGAGWGAKRWPAERYAELAIEFQRIGYDAIINLGPNEAEFGEIICAKSQAMAMTGSIGQLVACTRRASLFIGGDTGPLHLAAALQVPVVGIYGPTDPARNGPYWTPARVLRHIESVRDHTRRKEPEAGLLTITVSDVLESAKDVLQAQSSRLSSSNTVPST